MATAGISSGLDVNGIVSQLMQLERRPLASLQRKEAAITTRIAAVARLQGGVAALQTAAGALARPATWSSARADVSGTGLAAVVSDPSSAALGSYQIKVTRLAAAHVLASQPFAAATDVLGNGAITLQVGSTTTTVSIDASNNTLAGVRDAINAAQAGVSAALVNDGGQVRLTLTATATGAASAIRITVQEEGTAPADPANLDDTGLSRLTFDGSIALSEGENTAAGRQMLQTRAAQDAAFEVNGLALSSSGNRVTGVIEGVTLDLKAASDTAVTTVTVERDRSAMRSALDAFVKAYNDLAKTIAELTRFDPTTRSAAVLNGDATVRGLQSELAGALRLRFGGRVDDFATLSDIGVELGRDGTLSVNGTRFEAAAATPEKLMRLFSSDGAADSGRGIGVRIAGIAASVIGTEGLLPTRTRGLQAQIDALKSEEGRLNRKLELVEARLRRQYSMLDAQLQRIQNTSNSLANALNQLPGASRDR